MAKKRNRFRSTGGQSAPKSDAKFKAPTPGLEDVHFTHGTSMAAADFSQVQSKLSRYVGSKAKGVMGTKAIMSLKNPNLAEPIEPIRVMKKVISDGVETKEDSNVPVMSDISFNIESEKYPIIWKSWNIKNESWTETNGMISNLVLQHVPEVLESLLKSQLK